MYEKVCPTVCRGTPTGGYVYDLPDRHSFVFVKRISILVVAFVVLLTLLPLTIVEAQSFRNCAAVKAKYPNGVAINFGVICTSGAEINRQVYLANQRLDRDTDGLICEDEWAQSIGTGSATTLTPAVTSTVAPLQVPGGTWFDTSFWSTERLLFGRGYRFYTCSTGRGTTSLSVKIGSEWFRKAVAVVSDNPTLCKDAAFPVLHSYYWSIDVKGPNAETYVDLRLDGFTSTTQTVRLIVTSESALTTTTTTAPPQRSIPAGSWEFEYLWDSKILSMNKRYMHVICVSGNNPNLVLTLSISINNTWVKKAESFPTSSELRDKCTDANFPIAHRFYWTPDWPGTPLDKYTSTLSMKVSGLSSDSFYSRRAFSSVSSESAYWRDATSNVARTLECAFGLVTCSKKP